jgi:NifU-like protein involved in Fe-S cluster formation
METIEAENTGKEIDNADKLVKLYKEAIDDLGGRYETKFKEITELYENKVKLLQDEINLHKRIIAQLKEENTMLRNKLKDNKIE